MSDIALWPVRSSNPAIHSLQPVLCYWEPSEEDPFEMWMVCVFDRGRWYQYQPEWEGGRGYGVDAPDYFSINLRMISRKVSEQTIPLKVDGCGGEDDERR